MPGREDRPRGPGSGVLEVIRAILYKGTNRWASGSSASSSSACITAGGYFYPAVQARPGPRGRRRPSASAVLMIYLETRIRRVPFRVLWSAGAGLVLGLFLGWMFGAIYQSVVRTPEMATFIRIFFLVIMPYIGLLIGTKKPEWLEPAHLASLFKEKRAGPRPQDHRHQRHHRRPHRRPLRHRASSRARWSCRSSSSRSSSPWPTPPTRSSASAAGAASTSSTASRSPRWYRSSLSDLDFPDVKDVDSKLIECAKAMDAKIVTNDFNLNKVARIRGIGVLNINELVNALRPVALPGETMSVFILKEGKEKDQGVAYLEDGTMVVVDNSRRMIGQTIDVTVTSVLQTTVGKMIFGRFANGEAEVSRTVGPGRRRRGGQALRRAEAVRLPPGASPCSSGRWSASRPTRRSTTSSSSCPTSRT
ncbi:MAG: TRAM domain-containing protein [Desulfomicrobium escambiense]|nr:TRAM domain-containing protein [Desulfomicrobium escambiense]